MRKVNLLIIFIFACAFTDAQNIPDYLLEIKKLRSSNPDSAILLGEKAKKILKKKPNEFYLAYLHNYLSSG